jgi:hypothetical protein
MDGANGNDLVVQDPCGSWIALRGSDGGYTAQRSTLIDNVGPVLYMEVLHEGALLAMGNYDVLSFLKPSNGQTALLQLPGVPLNLQVTRLFVPLRASNGGLTLLAQRGNGLVLVTVSDTGTIRAESGILMRQLYASPYLAPFEGYNQLTDVSLENCPVVAVGVGIFSATAGRVPRRLQALVLDDGAISDGAYTASDFGEVNDVLAVAVTEAPETSEFLQLLGIIHDVDGEHRFSILGRSGCDDWIHLDSQSIEFEYRTPPSPAWGEVKNVPPTGHVILVGTLRQDEGGVDFYHYDGYDVRVVEVDALSWQIVQRFHRVHDDRSDLSYQ